MIHTLHKAHQQNADVYCVILTPELPFIPLLFECKVSRAVHHTNMTFYHLLPINFIDTLEFIRDKCKSLTIRCYNNTLKQAKDITFNYDAESSLTWCQQFVTENDNWLFDCTYQNTFDNITEAIQLIHKLNNLFLANIQMYQTELLKRSINSYYVN